MRLLALVIIAGTGACSTQEAPDPLIDEIERTISLPTGAHPLKEYARVYAVQDDRVVAAFFIPSSLGASPTCEDYRESEGDSSYAVAVTCPPPLGMSAGELRRFDGHEIFAPFTDGGCGWIDITYARAERAFERIQCHGEA